MEEDFKKIKAFEAEHAGRIYEYLSQPENANKLFREFLAGRVSTIQESIVKLQSLSLGSVHGVYAQCKMLKQMQQALEESKDPNKSSWTKKALNEPFLDMWKNFGVIKEVPFDSLRDIGVKQQFVDKVLEEHDAEMAEIKKLSKLKAQKKLEEECPKEEKPTAFLGLKTSAPDAQMTMLMEKYHQMVLDVPSVVTPRPLPGQTQSRVRL